ncbi:pilus assembly protein [Methylobacterium sp. J-078]|uniref:TadE/TadG family type IV pilus assembly protein n=1 Tax=Methylobacterium sp. J-078 TaxID=2836657 RepID=UPI001FB94E76|nr:TadE/TadG family type IV pilus assembly protein [Methylobacterium sp. J-078]MCJ2044807.1 pilus assembly protein [Methylobacterium sp. J-078]
MTRFIKSSYRDDIAGRAVPVVTRLSRWRVDGFRRSSDGATAVEFALVIPLFCLLLIEIFQGGLYIFCTAALEKATSDASRAVMIGALSASASTASGFRTSVVCANLIAGLSCDNVVTSLQTTTLSGSGTGFSKFVSADELSLVPVTMNNAQTDYCTGAPGTYGYIQVFYAVPVFSPIWRTLANATDWNGAKVVFTRAAIAFRNEPYTTANVATGC